MFQLSSRSKGRLEGVDPKLVEVVELAITLTKMDFGIPEYGGLRTVEEQKNLFQTGRSKADGVSRPSYHQSGRAVDVYAYINGEASWDRCHLSKVANAMLQAANKLGYNVSWGGLWRGFVDQPHFQICMKIK